MVLASAHGDADADADARTVRPPGATHPGDDHLLAGTTDQRPDQVAAFQPAILGVRSGTTALSVALASPAFADHQ